MLDTVFGLPTHPLLVHATVVLLPLTALVAAGAAWRSERWRRVGGPLALWTLVVLGLTVLTKETGEHLEHRLPHSDLIAAHAELGDVLPVFAAFVFLVSAGLWWLGRRSDPGADGRAAPPPVRATVAVVAVLLAVATCWWTFRVGHSGALSVWHDVPAAVSAPAAPGGQSSGST